MISGIYSITHIATQKRYIGSSIHIKRRWNSHKSALNRGINDNPHLQNAWTKYGKDSFIFEILEENIPANLLEEKENEYIVLFGIADKNTNIFYNDKGYNTNWAGRTGCVNPANYKKGPGHHLYGTIGKNKGKIFSEEVRKNMSEGQKGKITGRKGIPKTEEEKKKISDKKKNRPWSEARRLAQIKRKEKS